MAGEPAIEKVKTALKARLEQISGLTVFIDRPAGDSVHAEERPAVVIRVTAMTFDTTQGQDMTVHTAGVDLDIYDDGTSLEAITTAMSGTIADIVEKIAEDRTLGGLLQTFEEAEATSDGDSVADLGAALLSYELIFFTPRGDFRTIVGLAGLVP